MGRTHHSQHALAMELNNAGNPAPRQGNGSDDLLSVLHIALPAVGRWKRRLSGALERLGNTASLLPQALVLEENGKALLSGPPPPKGASRAKITIWGNDGPTETTVDLDPATPAREQAVKWLAQAAKLRRGTLQTAERIKIVAAELEEAQAWETKISGWSVAEPDRSERRHRLQELAGLQARLLPRGLWPQPPRRKDEPREDVPLRFVLDGGWILLAGRSGTENDFLTGKIARSDDLWFHAAHVPGAHVILKSPDGRPTPPPPALLAQAAGLAAWLSKLRAQEKAEVHYTRRRNVRKPRKSPAGTVLLEHRESVFVKPVPPPREG